MRFNRKQLNESNTAARNRGLNEGRKYSWRRAISGFFLGAILGSVSFFGIISYWDKIIDIVR